MVDNVSPIFFKKIDLPCIKNEERKTIITFYDKFSGKIICVNRKSCLISIYSKKLDLIKEVVVYFNYYQPIYQMTLSQSLKYLFIVTEENSGSKKESLSIYLIHLETHMFLLNFSGEKMNNLLGVIFTTDEIVLEDGDKFLNVALVFTNRVSFLKVYLVNQNLTPKNKTNNLTKKKSISISNKNKENQATVIYKHTSSTPICKFFFEKHFMIFCIQKGDLEKGDYKISLDFFNLSQETFYSKPFTFKVSFDKNNSKSLSKYYKQTKEKNTYEIKRLFNDRFSQFYLEKIYSKLYLISLNYDDNKIHLYHVSDLNLIIEELFIEFEGTLSTLQFFDNLILIHNLESQCTKVIDINISGENKVLLYDFPMTFYDLYKQNMEKIKNEVKLNISYSFFENDDLEGDYKLNVNLNVKPENLITISQSENRFIYSKQPIITNKIMQIMELSKTITNTNSINNYNDLWDIDYYEIKFNHKIYLESCINKKQTIYYLFHRKNAKKAICSFIMESIFDKCRYNNVFDKKDKYLSSEQIKEMFKISCFYHLRNLTILSKKITMRASDDFTDNQPNEIIIPYAYLFPRKENLVDQKSYNLYVFRKLSLCSQINQEILFSYIIMFYLELINSNIIIKKEIEFTTLNILKNIKNFNKIYLFFTGKEIKTIKNFGTYLITYIANNDHFSESERNLAYQTGMDILYRAKAYNEIIKILFLRNKIEDIVHLVFKYDIKINQIEVQIQKELLKYFYIKERYNKTKK